MKRIINRFSFLLLAVVSLIACEKVENKISFKSGTEPVLTASTNAVRLEAGEEANMAIRLNWTNPNYQFTTGISSHDVKYKLEIDTLASFANPRRFETVYLKDLSKTFTVGELNSIFGNTMQIPLDPRRTYTFYARITSSLGIGTEAIPYRSNTVSFTASHFPPPPKVPVPTAGTLWIVGSAVASGWSNPSPVWPAPFATSQRFTRRSTTLYELTIPMIPGGGYKLIQTEGDWGNQYSKLSGTALNGEFERRDATQFDAPAQAGIYKLTFNFQLGTYTVVKQ